MKMDDPILVRWLAHAAERPEGAERERLRALDVDECDGCGPRGRYVRYCPIHGLNGLAPR